MTIILASKTAFLDHALHSRLLIHHSIRDAQRTEKGFGHLLEHEKLGSRDAAVIAEVAAVRGQNKNRRAVNHTHLRQRPARYQQSGNAGDKSDSPATKSGAGAEGDTVSLSGDGNRGEIGILPHRFGESERRFLRKGYDQIDAFLLERIHDDLY